MKRKIPAKAIKILVFVIERHGRALTKKSLHSLISQFLDKVRDVDDSKAVVASTRNRSIGITVVNGKSVNDCTYLATQLLGKGLDEWETIYLHGDDYSPVLLSLGDKEKLMALLQSFKGENPPHKTSADAIYKILADTGVYRQGDN